MENCRIVLHKIADSHEIDLGTDNRIFFIVKGGKVKCWIDKETGIMHVTTEGTYDEETVIRPIAANSFEIRLTKP